MTCKKPELGGSIMAVSWGTHYQLMLVIWVDTITTHRYPQTGQHLATVGITQTLVVELQ